MDPSCRDLLPQPVANYQQSLRSIRYGDGQITLFPYAHGGFRRDNKPLVDKSWHTGDTSCLSPEREVLPGVIGIDAPA